MFYDKQPIKQKEDYKKLLNIMGSLSCLFSESNQPYLHYRCHENIFCLCFSADNLSRHDCSADARKGVCGIGLKTWVGTDDQKIAEFGRQRPQYKSLKGIELIKNISEGRNERIRITKNLYNIDELVYHIVKRVPGQMQIAEHAFETIDIDNIKILERKGKENNIYFTDGKHEYHFSLSKNTLYMIFSDLVELDIIPVSILRDPYLYLMKLHDTVLAQLGVLEQKDLEGNGIYEKLECYRKEKQICLRLYSTKKGVPFVPNKSGLNQWNGERTKTTIKEDGSKSKEGIPRDPNELYIPFPKIDRDRNPDFFPPRDVPFQLHLPDGKIISAKVCQDQGKAIMSNPNKELGKWLLRDIFELPIGTVVTYEMLLKFGIDSVIFTKLREGEYSIDFVENGTYENFYKD